MSRPTFLHLSTAAITLCALCYCTLSCCLFHPGTSAACLPIICFITNERPAQLVTVQHSVQFGWQRSHRMRTHARETTAAGGPAEEAEAVGGARTRPQGGPLRHHPAWGGTQPPGRRGLCTLTMFDSCEPAQPPAAGSASTRGLSIHLQSILLGHALEGALHRLCLAAGRGRHVGSVAAQLQRRLGGQPPQLLHQACMVEPGPCHAHAMRLG